MLGFSIYLQIVHFHLLGKAVWSIYTTLTEIQSLQLLNEIPKFCPDSLKKVFHFLL